MTYGFPLGFRPENVRVYEEKGTTLCNGTRAGFTTGIISGGIQYRQWPAPRCDESKQGNMQDSELYGRPDESVDNKGENMRTVVRRLTPLECERLQGFPDGWTDIGEWTDSKGKKHKEADSPRYKALGNSIALPFWFYLLRRISAQYERPATLGSLFDGIGGFPLCWERCNGKGTARWASEIEEFPMAVTKYHFGEE